MSSPLNCSASWAYPLTRSAAISTRRIVSFLHFRQSESHRHTRIQKALTSIPCSTFKALPRDMEAWAVFTNADSSIQPLSPLTPLSQLIPLDRITNSPSSAPCPNLPTFASHLPRSTAASQIAAVKCGFDPESPRNKHFEAPRQKAKKSRWTDLQRGLAAQAEEPSSLLDLESQVRLPRLAS